MILLAYFVLSCCLFYASFVGISAFFFTRSRCNSSPGFQPTVSVIIPARNEANYIETCLKSVLNQTYPQELIEIIFINDHSTDNTLEIATHIAKDHSRLKVFSLQREGINSYKKAAITQGIHVSSGEIIIQTDGDCEVPSTWIEKMISQFTEDVVFVSGPVYLRPGSGWIEKFQTLESMGLVALGAGAITAGMPNMCNGANMAYKRTAFEAVNGFEGVNQIASGDDELLMQKIAKAFPKGLVFAKCRGTIVETPTLTSLAQLRAQRLRWVSKARYYENRWTNGIQLISYFAFWGFPLFFVLGFGQSVFWIYLFLISIGKLCVDLLIMVPAARFFHKLRLLVYILPLQPFYIAYVIWVGIAGNFIKEYHWKERKVK